MHDHESMSSAMQTGLGVYYLLVMLMNVGFALYFYVNRRNTGQTLLWLGVALLFLVHALAYFGHWGWVLPPEFKDAVNGAMNAVTYFVLSVVALFLFLVFRSFLYDLAVARRLQLT